MTGGELKKIVEKYRAYGFKDSDIMAICHIRETHLYLIDDGREGGIPSIPYREIISCDLAFERRAKLYVKSYNFTKADIMKISSRLSMDDLGELADYFRHLEVQKAEEEDGNE